MHWCSAAELRRGCCTRSVPRGRSARKGLKAGPRTLSSIRPRANKCPPTGVRGNWGDSNAWYSFLQWENFGDGKSLERDTDCSNVRQDEPSHKPYEVKPHRFSASGANTFLADRRLFRVHCGCQTEKLFSRAAWLLPNYVLPTKEMSHSSGRVTHDCNLGTVCSY